MNIRDQLISAAAVWLIVASVTLTVCCVVCVKLAKDVRDVQATSMEDVVNAWDKMRGR